MGFIVIIVLALFIARLFYIIGKSKENSKKRSELNRDIYKHAYKLGLSHDDLNEFEINAAAKEKLKERVMLSRNLANTKGKTEALQIAEAALSVTEDLKNSAMFEEFAEDLLNGVPEAVVIGDLKIDGKRAEINYGRLVSEVFSATNNHSKYKGKYIFLMKGVSKIITEQKTSNNYENIEEIDEIEYTDGLRIEKESTTDDVSEFIEKKAVPVIKELYGNDKASEFSDDVLKLYISMSISIREEVAKKAIANYIESDDIAMLMKWLKPFDYMIDHMPSIENYLDDKGIIVEETDDLTQGFYKFSKH